MSAIAVRMVGADFLKLRKRRGTLIWALVLTLLPLLIYFIVRAAQHSSGPAEHPPAGGAAGFTDAVRILALFFGPLAAIMIGTDGGAGDLAAGVFRDLVVTGRSRVALFAARVPAALGLCWLVVGFGYLILCARHTDLRRRHTESERRPVHQRPALHAALDGRRSASSRSASAALTGSRPAALTVLIGWQLVASPVLANISSLGSSRKLVLSQAIVHFSPVSLGDRGGRGATVTMSSGAAVLVIARVDRPVPRAGRLADPHDGRLSLGEARMTVGIPRPYPRASRSGLSRLTAVNVRPPPTHSDAIVEATDLSPPLRQGEAAVDALVDVNVSFPAGRFTAIMGPSGSGKSTLMHILAGLDRPTSGSVRLDGVELTELDDKALTNLRRDRIGFIFQTFNLLPVLSAEENILLPLSIAGRKPDAEWLKTLIDTVGIRDRLTHRPAELSGGQQQRVAVARALVSRPAVVFADEPSGNLDSKSSGDVLGLLREAVDKFGQTVVMVTHDAHAASYADRLLVLADGRIVHDGEAGSPEQALDLMKAVG